MKSDFEIICVNWSYIIIRDKCTPGCMSVTNDVENVVAALFMMVHDLNGKKIYYIDSYKRLDEIIHDKGAFVEFSSLPHKKVVDLVFSNALFCLVNLFELLNRGRV